MINEFKRSFCKHEWRVIDEQYVQLRRFNTIYGCDKCGSVEEVHHDHENVWKFKQEWKGAIINDGK